MKKDFRGNYINPISKRHNAFNKNFMNKTDIQNEVLSIKNKSYVETHIINIYSCYCFAIYFAINFYLFSCAFYTNNFIIENVNAYLMATYNCSF